RTRQEHQIMRNLRSRKVTPSGNAVTIVAGMVAVSVCFACAASFTVGLYGLFSQWVQRASDSGALGVGAGILGISVPLNVSTGRLTALGYPQWYLTDNFPVADAQGNINLLAYNQMAARAALIFLNAKQEGTDKANARVGSLTTVVDEIGGALNT